MLKEDCRFVERMEREVVTKQLKHVKQLRCVYRMQIVCKKQSINLVSIIKLALTQRHTDT